MADMQAKLQGQKQVEAQGASFADLRLVAASDENEEDGSDEGVAVVDLDEL